MRANAFDPVNALDWKYLLKGALLPPGALALLGLAGLALWWRRPRAGFALSAVSIGGIWLLATPIVADFLLHNVERYPAFDPAHLSVAMPGAQAIVILAGGIRERAPEIGGDAPSRDTLPRLIEGARIARSTHLPILVSGSRREVGAMRRCLEEDLGVAVRWEEAASNDTHENAVFSARLLKELRVARIILVTSSAHMTRAVAEFIAAGLEVTAAPAEMSTRDAHGLRAWVPTAAALERSHTALYEWAGQLARIRPLSR